MGPGLDNKKARKNKKAIKEEKKSRKKNREGKSTVTATCANTVKDILNNGKRKAGNFDRQKKRIEARLPKIANKLEKASEYNQTMEYLIAANASAVAVPPATRYCWMPWSRLSASAR